jgi:hypothetical protein
MTTTKNVEKMGRTAQEEMTGSARRTGEILSGYLAEAQEINTEFARKATETWIEGFRKQTELNQRMIQKIYGEAEGQTGAVQETVRDLMSTYSVPFFGPFGTDPFALPYWREGMEVATRNAEQVSEATRQTVTSVAARSTTGLPIAGYDEMNVAEISEELDSLSAEDLKLIRDYEKRNKNRETLIEQIDRKIKATA